MGVILTTYPSPGMMLQVGVWRRGLYGSNDRFPRTNSIYFGVKQKQLLYLGFIGVSNPILYWDGLAGAHFVVGFFVYLAWFMVKTFRTIFDR